MNHHLLKFENSLDLIGNTPIKLLSKDIHQTNHHILLKMEHVQPGGSVKDRAAKNIILQAKKDGRLKNGQAVVEMTSGNMGAGLAIVCGILGHPFIACMSAGNSPERARMLRGLGARVIIVPQVTGELGKVTGDDILAADKIAKKISVEENAFFVDQFNNMDGLHAHRYGTAIEIAHVLDKHVDAFVAIVGSAGTFVGCSRGFKDQDMPTKCYAVEPKDAQILAGEVVTKPQHLLQGTSYGFIPPLWDDAAADGFLAVGDDEAKAMQKLLATKEGLYVGYSASANVCASIQLAKMGVLKENSHIATILCDTGLKYSFE